MSRRVGRWWGAQSRLNSKPRTRVYKQIQTRYLFSTPSSYCSVFGQPTLHGNHVVRPRVNTHSKGKGRVGRGGECPLLKSRLPTLFDRITQPSKSISFSSYFRISRSIYDSFSLFFFSLSFFDRDKSYCAINDKRTNECVCIKKEKRQWETPLNNLGWKIVKSINRIDRKIELLEIKGVLFAVIMIIILNFFVDRLILLVVTMVNNCIG